MAFRNRCASARSNISKKNVLERHEIVSPVAIFSSGIAGNAGRCTANQWRCLLTAGIILPVYLPSVMAKTAEQASSAIYRIYGDDAAKKSVNRHKARIATLAAVRGMAAQARASILAVCALCPSKSRISSLTRYFLRLTGACGNVFLVHPITSGAS